MAEHDDLSGGELEARLAQRGVADSLAAWMVRSRDHEDTADTIDRILDGVIDPLTDAPPYG